MRLLPRSQWTGSRGITTATDDEVSEEAGEELDEESTLELPDDAGAAPKPADTAQIAQSALQPAGQVMFHSRLWLSSPVEQTLDYWQAL